MGVQTTLGTRYYIFAGEPATYDQAGFEALAWTEVGEVTSVGDFGPEFEDVPHVPLKTGITQHRKGTLDYGEMNFTIGEDYEDAGQQIIEEGVDGSDRDTVFSHKIVLQNGRTIYSVGQLFSNPFSIGEASSIVNRMARILLSNKLVKVNPAP